MTATNDDTAAALIAEAEEFAFTERAAIQPLKASALISRLATALTVQSLQREAAECRMAAVADVLEIVWNESQQGQTVIRDAGIMQDIVERVRAAATTGGETHE